jgi:hypothetical protein
MEGQKKSAVAVQVNIENITLTVLDKQKKTGRLKTPFPVIPL